MAVKTITIDLEAYETLSRLKAPGQSFSQVIKEHFRGSRADELRRALDEVHMTDSTLDRIDDVIRGRANDVARAPEL